MIRVEGLNFYYMIGENILEDISFTAEKGEIIGILGANGVENYIAEITCRSFNT